MENKVLEENLKALEEKNPILKNKLSNHNFNGPDFQLALTQNQQYNLVYKNIPLHNEIDAILEAKQIVSKIADIKDKSSVKIVFGLGLGYLLDEMATSATQDGAKIILYEPNLDILSFVFSIAKIDAIYNKNVEIAFNYTQLRQKVKKYMTLESKASLYFLSSYKKMFNDDILKTVEVLEKVQGELSANKNTMNSKALHAISNSIKNIDYILNSPNIEELKDIYKNKTALILSSGPSLKENIEEIRKIKDKCIIFALSSSVNLLIENDIIPDFVVNAETIDGASHIAKIRDNETYFILEGFCNSNLVQIAHKKAKNVFNYLSDGNFLNYWIKKLANSKKNLKTLGTVSYTALNSALLMGFNKIVMCGQDLAYKNGECYAKGSQFEHIKCVFDEEQKKYVIKISDIQKHLDLICNEKSNRAFEQAALTYYIKLLNENLYTVKGQDGSMLPTQTGYALFIDYFADFALEAKENNKDLILINSSTGGAQIDGFVNQNIKEAFENENVVERLDLTKYKPVIDKNNVGIKIKRFYEKLKELKELNQAISINCQKALNELSVKKIVTSKLEKNLVKQNELINKMQNFCKDEEIFILARVYFGNGYIEIPERLHNKNPEQLKIYLEKTKAICEKYIKNIDDNLNSLANCQSIIF